MHDLFQIGEFAFGILDILDVLIASYLVYLIYKLLKGGIAFNIFIGITILYGVWWVVRMLKMPLLTAILGAFMSVGVLIIVIIFQPEIRRFLLYVGNEAMRNQNKFLKQIFPKKSKLLEEAEPVIDAICNAMIRMSKSKTGALIVLSSDGTVGLFANSGVAVDASVSEALLESIFHKESPLHDGAVIIAQDRIHTASAIMPVSENTEMGNTFGLRHRAAMGVSEANKVVALVVSEETGDIAYAYDGELKKIGSRPELKEVIVRYHHLAE